MSYRRRGAIYLMCYAGTPYKHARHYLGFAYPDLVGRQADEAILAEIAAAWHTRITNRRLTPLQAAGVACRIAAHRAGTGARLTQVLRENGIQARVTRIWTSATEAHEKALKDRNDGPALCPLCNPGTRAGTVVIPKRYRRKRRTRRQERIAA